MDETWLAELEELLEGDVATDEQTRDAHSRDWSLFRVLPQVVVFPRHAQDIGRLVQWVSEKHDQGHTDLSLTARAGGTGMTGGSLNTSIIVDVQRYMNTLVSVERVEPYEQIGANGRPFAVTGEGTVQPGCWYRDFEAATLEQNLIMPCFPASKTICAVGGMAANNGAGEKTLKYGQNKDFVKCLRAVLADGNEYLIEPLTYSQLVKKMAQNDFEGHLYLHTWQQIQKHYDLIESKRPPTSKNSAGYLIWEVLQAPSIDAFKEGEGYFDLSKLLVGAQGTTGIITEITYKLVELQEYDKLLVIFIQDLKTVPKLVKTLHQFDLETMEVYDDNTAKFAVRFAWDFVRSKGLFGAIRFALSFLPEIWMALTGGVPKLVMLAEFVADSEAQVEQEVRAAHAAVQAVTGVKGVVTGPKRNKREHYQAQRERFNRHHHGFTTRIAKSEADEDKYWQMRRDSFKLLTSHAKGMRTAPFIDDFVIDPQKLDEFLPRLIKLLNQYDLFYTIAGHIGNGNFHIIPLVKIGQQDFAQTVLELSPQVYDLVLQYDGSISAEHNDGIVRTPYLPQMFGPDMMEVFEAIKDRFDPLGLFNPGKKVRGSFDTITRYLEI